MRNVTISLVLCFGFGCDTAKKPPPAAVETAALPAAPAPVASTPTPVAPPAPKVELVTAGKEPYQALRWKFTKGAKQSMKMTMKMAVGMKMGEREMPKVESPPMEMDMELSVKDQLPDGSAQAEFKVVKIDVKPAKDAPPELVDQMKNALGMLKGMIGSYSVNERGFVKNVAIAAPPQTPPQVRQTLDGIKQSMNQMLAPLPEEAVGVGGKWEIKTDLNRGGMKISQVTSMEVTKMKGDRVDVQMTIKQDAPAQSLSPPGAPPGQSAELVSLKSTGGGKASWDLGKMVPPKVNVSTSMNMHMRAPGPDGKKQEMKMSMDMEMDIKAK